MRLLSKWFFILLYCFSLSSFANSNKKVGVTVFPNTHQHSGGVHVYGDLANLKSIKMENQLESWIIRSGYEVRFYEGLNFTGTFHTRKSRDNHRALGFYDKTKSLRIIKYASSTPAAVIMYSGKNYSGDSLTIKGDIGDLESLDKKMLSYKVGKGYQVRFYTEKAFQGRFYTRSSDEADTSSWGPTVRSMQILKYGSQPAGSTGSPTTTGSSGSSSNDDAVDMTKVAVKLFSQPDYKGDVAYITENAPALNTMGWDRKMRSFVVTDGYEVRFFSSTDFSGKYYTREYGASDGDDASWGANIRSLRILSAPPGKGVATSTGDSWGGSGRPPFDKIIARLYTSAFKKDERGKVYQHIHTWDQTKAPGFPIHSYTITKGYWLRFWSEAGWKGSKWDRAENAAEQNSCQAFGDCEQIKAIEIMDRTSTVIAGLYSLDRYRGNSMDIRDGPWDDVETITRRGHDLPNLASIKVHPGWRVTVEGYKTGSTTSPILHFEGNNEQIRVNGQLMKIKRITWKKSSNNSTSSSRSLGDDVAVRIYDGKNWDGDALDIKQEYTKLSLFDNKLSSYWVNDCYIVRFHEHENFKGRHFTVPDKTRPDRKGKVTNWDNLVSSIEILGVPYKTSTGCTTNHLKN